MKKVFIKCEVLKGIIVASLTLDKNTKSYKFRREYSTIGLSDTPYSLEINDFTEKPTFRMIEEYIDKEVTEGSILWYRCGNDIDFPCPIVVYTQALQPGNTNESDGLSYSIIPDTLSKLVRPKVNMSSKSVDMHNCLKKVKTSD